MTIQFNRFFQNSRKAALPLCVYASAVMFFAGCSKSGDDKPEPTNPPTTGELTKANQFYMDDNGTSTFQTAYYKYNGKSEVFEADKAGNIVFSVQGKDGRVVFSKENVVNGGEIGDNVVKFKIQSGDKIIRNGKEIVVDASDIYNSGYFITKAEREPVDSAINRANRMTQYTFKPLVRN